MDLGKAKRMGSVVMIEVPGQLGDTNSVMSQPSVRQRAAKTSASPYVEQTQSHSSHGSSKPLPKITISYPIFLNHGMFLYYSGFSREAEQIGYIYR